MSKRNRNQNSATKKAEPRNSQNFVIGLVAGIALIAVVAYALFPKSTPQEHAPASQAAASAGVQQPIPTPLPVFNEASVAATERISAVDAKQLLDERKAVVIDVRDRDGYAAGHIPGALQIPLSYVQGEIPWFPQDKKLITYCT